jgi:CRP-like cAMP-binding protein
VVLEVGGEEVIRLASLTDGQFFGEMSLLDGAPRAASVISTERSQIIGFFSSDLVDLIGRAPKLGFKIVLRISQLMADRLRETVAEYRKVLAELRRLSGA